MKHDIINLDSKKVGTVELNKDIFSVPIRKDILQDVVNWQLSNRRQGTHKVKQKTTAYKDVVEDIKKFFKNTKEKNRKRICINGFYELLDL